MIEVTCLEEILAQQTFSSLNRLLLLLSLLSGLGDLSSLSVGLLNGLDDTDSDGLPHVTDGESTERGYSW